MKRTQKKPRCKICGAFVKGGHNRNTCPHRNGDPRKPGVVKARPGVRFGGWQPDSAEVPAEEPRAVTDDLLAYDDAEAAGQFFEVVKRLGLRRVCRLLAAMTGARVSFFGVKAPTPPKGGEA